MFGLAALGRCRGCPSVPLARVTASGRQQPARGNAGPPPKLECFIDGKKVLVDPGTTVLQVDRWLSLKKKFES
jgi:hypothetical protein